MEAAAKWDKSRVMGGLKLARKYPPPLLRVRQCHTFSCTYHYLPTYVCVCVSCFRSISFFFSKLGGERELLFLLFTFQICMYRASYPIKDENVTVSNFKISTCLMSSSPLSY